MYDFNYQLPESFYTKQIVEFIVKKEREKIMEYQEVIRECKKQIARGHEVKMNLLKIIAYRDILIADCLKEIDRVEFKRRRKSKKFVDVRDIKEKILCSDLLGEPLRRDINRWWYSIREEKIPSLCYYVDTNSFYDYGSGDGGSVIDLYMLLNKCSVSDAIKELSKKV